MTTLTDSEITNVCDTVYRAAKEYEPFIGSMFETMWLYGCRETETVELSRWTDAGSSSTNLQTMKRGGIRNFLNADLPSIFYSAIVAPPERGFLYSSRNLRDVFNKFSPYPQIYCKEKEISCHLFRHNAMKTLYNAGVSYSDIALYFAVSDAFVAQYYVDSIIQVP